MTIGYRFAADSDNIDFGDRAAFDGLTALTLSWHFIINDLAAGGNVVAKGSNNPFIFQIEAAGTMILAVVAGSSGLVCRLATGLVDDGEYVITITWTSSTGSGQDTFRCYVDDVSAGRTYLADSGQGGNGIDATTDVIGYGGEPATSARMDLWHVGAWNRVLNSGEITSLAGGAAPSTIASGLIWNTPLSDNPPVETVGSYTGTVTGATFLGGGGGATIPIIMHHLRQQGIS